MWKDFAYDTVAPSSCAAVPSFISHLSFTMTSTRLRSVKSGACLKTKPAPRTSCLAPTPQSPNKAILTSLPKTIHVCLCTTQKQPLSHWLLLNLKMETLYGNTLTSSFLETTWTLTPLFFQQSCTFYLDHDRNV